MEKSKSLSQLAEVIDGHVIGNPQTLVSDITHDSRQIGTRTLFVAVTGATQDGHSFAVQAATEGAVAICAERQLAVGVPQLIVGNTRNVLGQLADEVFHHPSRNLEVIGVTGTNGKTTVTHFIDSLFGLVGTPSGLIGTIGSRILGVGIPSARTTPEATDFQRLLATMLARGVEKVAVEVSSHALELGRVTGTKFAVAAFTNLSQDHLDFHGTMEDYRAAKMKLFTDYEVGCAVINTDDDVGRQLGSSLPGRKVGIGSSGQYRVSDIEAVPGGSRFRFSYPAGETVVSAPVIGEFNISNLAMAITCCHIVGAELGDLLEAVGSIGAVPGRFEIVSDRGEPTVIVDYAHTPDGISTAVAAARELTKGRVIVLIGAGGDRDKAKRAMMGAAASAGDHVVVTSDNPRSEDPDSIIDQVLVGVTSDSTRHQDREEAIHIAVSIAEPEDVVLILGKGHEQGQERDGVVIPFDDRKVARRELKRLWKSANSGPDSGSMGP